MSPPSSPRTPAGPSIGEIAEKTGAAVSAFVIPQISLVTTQLKSGYDPFSFYQLSIYQTINGSY